MILTDAAGRVAGISVERLLDQLAAPPVDWVEALATVGAFVAAALAAQYTYGQLREVRAEQQRTALDRRRAQAASVAAWLEGDVIFTAFVYIVNAGSLPVYRVCIRVIGPGYDARYFRPALAPSAPAVEQEITAALNDYLGSQPDAVKTWIASLAHEPGGRRDFLFTDGARTEMLLIEKVGVEVVFTDSSGIRWYRNADGILNEVDPTFMTRAEHNEDWSDTTDKRR